MTSHSNSAVGAYGANSFSVAPVVGAIVDSETNRTLMIDNYDSFTWNIYQYLCELGANVSVFRNDKITLEECIKFAPTHVVISPGPGHPSTDSGVSPDVLKYFTGKIPVLGVCLGHQAMYEVFGGKVIHAGEIKHGKTSTLHHDGKGLYKNIPNDIQVIRYHSLAGDKSYTPEVLEVTSTTTNGIIMGVRHRQFVCEGVQFHPESIKTEYGLDMIKNFLSWTEGTWEAEFSKK